MYKRAQLSGRASRCQREGRGFDPLCPLHKNEGFEESVYSNKVGKKINFFNLGFSNRWQKLLPTDIKEKVNEKFKKSLEELNYYND